MNWLRFSMGVLLALVLASVAVQRQREADLMKLRALNPKCIGDARAEGIRF